MSLICIRSREDKVFVAAEGRISTSNGDICAEHSEKIRKYRNGEDGYVIVGSVGECDIKDEFFKYVGHTLSFGRLEVNQTNLLSYVKKFRQHLSDSGFDLDDVSQTFVFVTLDNVVGIQMSDAKVFTTDYEGPHNAYGNCREYAMGCLDSNAEMEEVFKKAARRYSSINANVTTLVIER